MELHIRNQLILEHSVSKNIIVGLQYLMKTFDEKQIFPLFTAIKIKENDPCLSILNEILCYCILSGGLRENTVLDEENGFKANEMDITLIDPNRIRKPQYFTKLSNISNIFNFIECSEDIKRLIEILLSNKEKLPIKSDETVDITLKMARLKDFRRAIRASKKHDRDNDFIDIIYKSK